MSVHELKALARKHWAERLPEKVKELKADGRLNEALQGAANLAQTEIEHLMRQGYQEHEAREVALPKFILLKPEKDVPDELAEELAEMEREHQKNPPYQSLMGQSEIEPDGEWEEALRQLRLRNQAEKDKAKPSQPMSTHPATPEIKGSGPLAAALRARSDLGQGIDRGAEGTAGREEGQGVIDGLAEECSRSPKIHGSALKFRR